MEVPASLSLANVVLDGIERENVTYYKTLDIRVSGDRLSVDWAMENGTLQVSESVTGPWRDVESPEKPYAFFPSSKMQLFQVKSAKLSR